MLAFLINVAHVGYPLLFFAVMAESAGVPVPGETALIGAGVLASGGTLQIEVVIAIAAAAAIIGDNVGYLIGRRGGRWLLERPGAFQLERRRALCDGERFFARHGPKAVFLGRFVLALRTWTAWLAGASQMPWRSFLFWNACGGLCWASAVGLLAYFLGQAVGNVLEAFAIFGLGAVLVLLGGGLLAHRRRGRVTPGEGGVERPVRARSEVDPG